VEGSWGVTHTYHKMTVKKDTFFLKFFGYELVDLVLDLL